jgi:hypothetical protein
MNIIFLASKLHGKSKNISRKPHENPTTYESGCHLQKEQSFRWNTKAEKIRRSLKVIDIRHTLRSSANVGGFANSVLVLPMVARAGQPGGPRCRFLSPGLAVNLMMR